MRFTTRNRRIDLDTDSGFFLRAPLLGEVFYARGWGVTWTPAREVKRILEQQAAESREYLAMLGREEVAAEAE